MRRSVVPFLIGFATATVIFVAGILFFRGDGTDDRKEEAMKSSRGAKLANQPNPPLQGVRLRSEGPRSDYLDTRAKVRRQTEISSKPISELLEEIALEKPASPGRMGLMSQLAVMFASNDPQAGFKWLNSMSASDSERSLAASVFAQSLADANPALWAEMTSSLDRGPLLDSFIGAGLVGIAKYDAEEAWGKLHELKVRTTHVEATEERVLKGMATSNPMGLWRLLRNDYETLLESNFTAQDFFKNARFDREKDAVSLLSEYIGYDGAAEHYRAYVASLQADRIPEFAEALMMSRFDQEFKDKAVADLLDRSFWKFPLEAARMINHIHDQELRVEMANNLLQYARAKDLEIEREVNGVLEGRD